MKKCLQAWVLGLFLAGTASAKDVGYRAHTPSQSRFEVIGSEIPTPQRSSLEYRGRATIRAAYRFVYVEGYEYAGKLHLDIVPDPESLSTLPYLTRWANESSTSANKVLVTDAAKEIWVTNAADAAAALLGQELADQVMAGKYEKIHGEARIVIEGFTADYACTGSIFSTKFVAVEKEIVAPLTKVRLVLAGE